MAGDGLINDNGLICSRTHPKIVQLRGGRIVGCTGDIFAQSLFISFLERGGNFPNIRSNSFEALVLNPDGDCYIYDGSGGSSKISTPQAIGSGGAAALVAMSCGKSPKEAVEIACRYDCFSGGEITSIALQDCAS